MGFLLQSSQLVSRRLRINQIAQRFDNFLDEPTATNAIRRLGDSIRFLDAMDEGGNIVDRFWNIGKGLVGFLGSLVKGIQVSATAIVGWLRGAWNFLVNFDWNATDEALISQMDAANLTLASVWGGFVGEVLGTAGAVAVGYGLTIAVGAGINLFLPGVGSLLTPQLAKSVAIDTIKERLPELWDSFKNAAAQTMGILSKNLATSSFILARRLLKKAFPDLFKQWGTGERWTIATAFEEWVETATGVDWFNVALEEAAEEFGEAFWETGFVFANNLDRAIQEAQITRDEVIGEQIPQVIIELDPDTNESIILPDQPSRLAQQQVLTEISQFRRLRNRDIGFFTGEPIIQESRNFNYLRTGKVVFKDKPKPPYYDAEVSSISLKDLKAGLKWKDFKLALEPYEWGEHYVEVTLNRSRHQFGAWFSSVTAGTKYLKKLVNLIIDDDIIAVDSRTEVERNRYVDKSRDRRMMYPESLVITIKKPVTDREDATHDLAGNSYEKNLKKVILWTDTEPPMDDGSSFLT